MAKQDPQVLCERLFETFLAPLVLGGEMHPGKPFGGKNALSIGDGRPPSNADLLSRVGLARVRVARRIVAVDRFDEAPTGAEWALAAVLHDLVQSTHPGFDAAFRRSGPARVLSVIDKTLERIAPPVSVADALSRHSWLSRMFELARVDVEVRWWTGSETFLGTDPPARLLAWPELRRVQETKTPRPLMDLPTSGGVAPPLLFAGAVESFLAKTPLTDFATLDRASPAFAWTHANLAFAATRAGRTLALRSMALSPERPVDTALGRATRGLFARRAMRALFVALDLLRDRALMAAASRLAGRDAEASLEATPAQNDAAFAQSAGALAATQWIAQHGHAFTENERRSMLAMLAPAATSQAASEIRQLLPG